MFLHSMKYKAVSLLVLLMLLAIVIPTGFAQQQLRCGVNVMQTIEYGETIRGAVNYDEGAFYCFDAERGDNVTITLVPIEGNGNNLVPTVIITKGVIESQEDLTNPLGTQNASFPLETIQANVSIDADNTYMIVILGIQGTRGEFDLNLQVEQSQSLLGSSTNAEATEEANNASELDYINFCEIEDAAAISLSYGDSLTVEMSADMPQAFFCFEGEAGEYASIQVSNASGEIIPFAMLADPLSTTEGNAVYARAVSNSKQEVAHIIHELPVDGTYLIAVGTVNDLVGEFNIELSLSDDAPNDANCDSEPLNILSHSQWSMTQDGEQSQTITYNIGCENNMIMTLMGGNFILDYRVNSAGAFVFTMGDKDYITVSLDEDSWVIQSLDEEKQEYTFEPTNSDACSEESLSQLIRGAWVIDGGGLTLDFMCNGIALVTYQNTIDVANYTLEDGVLKIVEVRTGQVLFEGESEVDHNGMVWSSPNGEIPFANTLLEIDSLGS